MRFMVPPYIVCPVPHSPNPGLDPGCDSQKVIITLSALLCRGKASAHTTVHSAHVSKSVLLSKTNKDYSLSKECWKPRFFIPTAIN